MPVARTSKGNPRTQRQTTSGSAILSIIDFSESSKDVINWALGMAEKLHAPLTILYPYRLNQLDKKEDMVSVKKKIDHDAIKNFESLTHGISNRQKLTVDFRSEVGFIQDRVQFFAQRNNILFVVIGFAQAIVNKEILEEMISETAVPLVVIPSPRNN